MIKKSYGEKKQKYQEYLSDDKQLWLLYRTRPMCSSVSELPMPTSSNFCPLTMYVIFKDKIIKSGCSH